jgi:hypothetical protein
MALRSLQRDNDRGAILVHVALSLLAMMAFVAFTLDYGVMWASRGQAQNAADAGALAGAVAIAFDDSGDFTSTGAGKLNAFEATQRNVVWGNPPTVDIDTDITFPTCPADVGGGLCVRVDVHRTQVTGNPLPMFFGQLFGRTTQDIKASATAQVSGGNAARCMLPFMLSDRWEDNFDDNVDIATYPHDGDHQSPTFDPIAGWSNNDHYQEPQGDVYRPPYPGVTDPTGWTTVGDFGRQLILHDPVGMYSAGWAGIAQLPGLGTGADDFRDAMWNCEFNNTYVAIADPAWDCTAQGYPNDTTIQMGLDGCLSVKTGWVEGPAEQGIFNGGAGVTTPLVLQDEDAVWTWGKNCGPATTTGCVVKSISDDTSNMTSARIRPLPIINNTEYIAAGCSGTGCIAKVVNIVGFFVEGLCDDVKAAGGLDPGNDCDPGSNDKGQVVGRIVTLPGKLTGTGMPVDESSFVKVIQLVR